MTDRTTDPTSHRGRPAGRPGRRSPGCARSRSATAIRRVADPLIEPLWTGVRALAAIDAGRGGASSTRRASRSTSHAGRRGGARPRRPGRRADPRRLPDQARRARRQRRLRRDGQPARRPSQMVGRSLLGHPARPAPEDACRGARGRARGPDVRAGRHRQLRRHRPALARRRIAPRRPAARAQAAPRIGPGRVGPRPARRLRPAADRRLDRVVAIARVHRASPTRRPTAATGRARPAATGSATPMPRR